MRVAGLRAGSRRGLRRGGASERPLPSGSYQGGRSQDSGPDSGSFDSGSYGGEGRRGDGPGSGEAGQASDRGRGRRGRSPGHARAWRPGASRRPARDLPDQTSSRDAVARPTTTPCSRPCHRSRPACHGTASGTIRPRARTVCRTTTREKLTGEERDSEPGHRGRGAARGHRRGSGPGRIEAHRDARRGGAAATATQRTGQHRCPRLPGSGAGRSARLSGRAHRGPGHDESRPRGGERIGVSTGAPLASVTQPGTVTVTGVHAVQAAAPGKPAHGKTPSPAATPSPTPTSQAVATVPAPGGVVIQASGAMARGLEAEQVLPGGRISARCDGPGTNFWFVGPGAFSVGHIQLFLMQRGQPARGHRRSGLHRRRATAGQ